MQWRSEHAAYRAAHIRSMEEIQLRVTAGMPTGGQWTSRDREADTVTLIAPEPRASPTPSTLLGAAEALRIASAYAEEVASYMSIDDRDDVAQDALVCVLSSRRNDRFSGLTSALLRKAVSQVVISAIMSRTRTLRHQDAEAVKFFNEQLVTLAEELGRVPTRAEEDELAEVMRASCADSRNQPPARFHDRVRMESLDGEARGEVVRLRADDSDRAGTGVDALSDGIEEGFVSVGAARLRLWDTLAADEALPVTARGSMDPEKSVGLRRTVMAAGGVIEIASRYLRSGLIDSEMLQVMQPFSPHGDNDASVVARFLVSRGRVAQRLWDCALEAASS